MNPLEHSVIFSTPRRLARVSAWREHIPFGMFLVDLLRPRILVELGTHWGNSYCAFCQAVDELRLSTRCYAVDTWQGDDQSGRYGPEVLADLRAHHDPLYGSFSRLVESTFDNALDQFDDHSVDLLHIDGLHTYEAVRHDVEAWLPKLSDRGVLVLHDINARRRDYGVWKLWEELKTGRPHLELHHAHGLGVLAVGEPDPDEFKELLETPDQALQAMRDLFFLLGYKLRLQLHLDEGRRKRSELHRSLDAERVAWQEAIDRVVHAVGGKERDNAALRKELDTVRAEGRAACADRDASRADLEISRAELEASRAELEASRAELEASRADLASARAELASLRERKFVRLGLRLDSVRARLASREDDASRLRGGHESSGS